MSTTLFELPPAGLTTVRGFKTPVIEMTGTPGPLDIIDLGGTRVAGDVLHFVGTMADLAGIVPEMYFHTDGATGIDVTPPITADGPYSLDLTLTEDATQARIGGITHTTGKLTLTLSLN